MDNLSSDFLSFLVRKGVSNSSLRFYKSDLSHFSAWIILKSKTLGLAANNLDDLINILTPSLANEYKNYMVQNSCPSKTINRRLSTLRNLAKFLSLRGSSNFNFMEGVSNLTTENTESNNPDYCRLIINFKKHLEEQKVAPNTIKSYLSDLNQFINWTRSHARLT